MTRHPSAAMLSWLVAATLLAGGTRTTGAEPSFASVAELQAHHDRALVRDLGDYLKTRPRATDRDQAFMTLFNKAIEHDWFEEAEPMARQYLTAHPEGAVRPLAQIVATMARAQAGRFDEALARYDELMRGLGGRDQEDFAINFAENLAGAAIAAGEYTVARQVYETLLKRFGDDPALEPKVKGDLARLDLVGKPAPSFAVNDVRGKPVRLDALRGKYVLVEFWATWCPPCVADLPKLQAAYAKYHPHGLEVVAVSLDDGAQAVTDFVAARRIPWRQVHNATCGGDVVAAFGVTSIPASFLIDPRGTITRLDLRGPGIEKTLSTLIR